MTTVSEKRPVRRLLTTLKKAMFMLLMMSAVVVGTESCSSAKKAARNAAKRVVEQKKKKPTNNKDNKKEEPKRDTTPTGSKELTAACKKLGVSPNGVKTSKLYIETAGWLGTKYKYGGNTKKGADCSGFTGVAYKTVYGKTLARSSKDILAQNCSKISKSNLKEGDLVFFRTDGKKSSVPNHVGIYLKEDKFIHMSTSAGCIVSSMKQDYYVKNYICSGRVK